MHLSNQHPKINIEYKNLGDLKPDPNNPRIHSNKQVKQIAKSIETFSFNVPILVDQQLNIIAGHGRFLAAKELGLAGVPTIRLEHLTEAQIKAYQIADNRLTENSRWDDKLLGEQLKILSEMQLDFSVDITGFTVGEIDMKISGLDFSTEGRDDPADKVPDLLPAVSKLGDLWVMGKHRLYCGSALKAESYDRLMEIDLASMVFIDPPYNVKVDGHVSGLGSIKHREFAMASGEMTQDEFTKFLIDTFRLLVEYSVDGSIQFICMDWRHMQELLEAGKVYTELKNLCVWNKDNAGMGTFYRSQHELIFVFKNGKAPHRNNFELGQYGRHRSNVWSYPGANSYHARNSEEGNLLELHPTVKPVKMVADAILDCSARGEIILDCFMGSGTTLMAAERTGRVCYGIELDPIYIDTAIRRWQNFTGDVAIHAATGRAFAEIMETEHA